MAKPAARIAFLQGVLALGAVWVLTRAVTITVVQQDFWEARADSTRTRFKPVPAWRGTILDRNGDPLAVTRVTYHVSVAVEQLRDTAAAITRIARALSQPEEAVRASLMRSRNAYFRGPYTAAQVNQLAGVRGIYREPMLDRAYPRHPRAAPIVGGFNVESSRGRGGLEAMYDSLLKGSDGLKELAVDGVGRAFDLPHGMIRPAVRGRDVVLTIDAGLQAVVENHLERALQDFRADDGDVVILDVHTGEILAAASRRLMNGRHVPTASAFVEPYEPGSTAKIFTAAAALREVPDQAEKPRPAYGGTWVMHVGNGTTRTIEDVHAEHGDLDLAHTIKYSSNITISQFALEMTLRQHYTALRDFGFGTYAGVDFPGEGLGQLRRPGTIENRLLTQASWAQGYELMTTAVQMASAYAVFANGGRLLRPTLVREVRDDRGQPIWRHQPDVIRQVIAEPIAHRAMEFLALATDSGGTGGKAQLDRVKVIGKTGTAKQLVNGRYSSLYRASFGGIYPAHRPQVVIYVMINHPRGAYYGGAVAAPVVRGILQEGLALRNTPLDRSTLGAEVRMPTIARAAAPVPVTQVVTLGSGGVVHATPPATALPAVAGMELRDASYQLHQRGLTVRAVGRGVVRASNPAPGDSLPAGSLVTVYADSTR